MNTEQIESHLLINEWQLGQQLNQAVQSGKRDKFNLLISMLSDDARDFSQFSLLKSEEERLSERSLMESLQLREKQPLVNKGITQDQAQRFNDDIANNRWASVKLGSLLYNEAILSRTHSPSFADEVIENISLLAQERLEKELNKEKVTLPTPPQGINYKLMQTLENCNQLV
jgi:hypothetical protein